MRITMPKNRLTSGIGLHPTTFSHPQRVATVPASRDAVGSCSPAQEVRVRAVLPGGEVGEQLVEILHGGRAGVTGRRLEQREASEDGADDHAAVGMREAVQVFQVAPEAAVAEQIVLDVRDVEGREALVALGHPAPDGGQGERPAEGTTHWHYAVAP